MKVIVLLCVAIGLSACASVKKPYLWKAEKNGKEIYLFGTVHNGVFVKELPDSVFASLDRSEMLLTEVSGTVMEQMVAGDFEKEDSSPYLPVFGPKLHELISDRAWQEILKVRGDIYVEELETMKPGVVAYLYEKIKTNQPPKYVSHYVYSQHRLEHSMDVNLYRRARGKGKITGHLEEAKKLSDRCELAIDARALEQVIFSHKNYIEESDELFEAYRSHDSDKIRNYFGSDLATRCLFKQRHDLWLPVIESNHRTYSPLFVAVGVGHMLIKEDSLLTMLQQRGFKIEEVQ